MHADVKFALVGGDFLEVSNFQALHLEGEASPQSEALPKIIARADGSYAYAVTKTSEDSVT